MKNKKETLLQRIQNMERGVNVVRFTGDEFEAFVTKMSMARQNKCGAAPIKQNVSRGTLRASTV